MSLSLYFTAASSLIEVKKANTSWELIEHETPWDLMGVAVDSQIGNRIYLATFDHGLQISHDGGELWEPAGPGIASNRIMSVAVSPTEVVDDQQIVWAGTEPSYLYRSEDGGKTWSTFPALIDLPSRSTWRFPPRPYTHHVQSIQPDLHDNENIYIGIELGGVMKSVDRGKTWEDRKEGSQFDCHNLTMTEQAPGRLYEAAGGGFAESKDGGKTWRTFNDGLDTYTYLYDVVVSTNDPDTMIVSASKSARTAYMPSRAQTVLMRREGGKPWERIKKGLPESKGASVFSLLAHKKEPGVFYAVNNLGLYRSGDDGTSWERLPLDWPGHLKEKRIRGFVKG